MQSGIDSGRLRLFAETPAPTRAAVESEKAEQATAENVGTCQIEVGVKNPTKTGNCVTAASGSSKAFFGEDGPSFRDVLDSLNPLNQIPIVSDILANVTGHQPSTASKLAGGALATLISGPIGFAATLANVIFEDGAGKSPANAVYAAIVGDDAPVQVAKVDTAVEPVDATELASLETATGPTADAIAGATMQAHTAAATGSSGSSVLDLYGASGASAHASYKKAQLLPYLRDVNQSKVL